MLVILNRVRNYNADGTTDYGYIIGQRNFAPGRKYHEPTKDVFLLTERIFMHGFIAPPNKELDDLISLGVKLWVEMPENTLYRLSTSIVDSLESFALKFTNSIVNDSKFKPFEHLYFHYAQKDSFVENIIDRRWQDIVEQYNIRMIFRELPESALIDTETSEYLRILVIRLLTRGIRYALLVYKGNIKAAQTLFNDTQEQLEIYVSNKYDSGVIYIVTNKAHTEVKVTTEQPENLTKFLNYFTVK